MDPTRSVIQCISRGFNKHQRPMKCVGCFAQSSRLLFSPKKKQFMSFKNVVHKKYIIKSELKRKFIMICCQGPLICYALVTPEALLVTQTLFCISANFSHVSWVFLCRFTQNLFMCKLYLNLNIDICSLLVRIDCAAMIKHE